MAGYNRVVMVGNLTRDPEHKQLASGQSVCRMGIATNRQFRSRQSGEMVQEVCFVDIDVWGAQADSCNQYLEKGRQVLVEGRLKLDTWQDAEGNNRSKHSITAERVVFLSSGNSDVAEGSASQSNYSNKGSNSNSSMKAAAPKPSIADLQKEVEQIKSSKANTGEVSFKDEPPFQDDLPF
jgi:single-strand DNA-binding protein